MNAPFSWPKSSDSSRFSEGAAQLTASMGRSRRAEAMMNRPGDDFLAGAAFAADQHRGVAAGDQFDFLPDLLHRRRCRR